MSRPLRHPTSNGRPGSASQPTAGRLSPRPRPVPDWYSFSTRAATSSGHAAYLGPFGVRFLRHLRVGEVRHDAGLVDGAHHVGREVDLLGRPSQRGVHNLLGQVEPLAFRSGQSRERCQRLRVEAPWRDRHHQRERPPRLVLPGAARLGDHAGQSFPSMNVTDAVVVERLGSSGPPVNPSKYRCRRSFSSHVYRLPSRTDCTPRSEQLQLPPPRPRDRCLIDSRNRDALPSRPGLGRRTRRSLLRSAGRPWRWRPPGTGRSGRTVRCRRSWPARPRATLAAASGTAGVGMRPLAERGVLDGPLLRILDQPLTSRSRGAHQAIPPVRRRPRAASYDMISPHPAT